MSIKYVNPVETRIAKVRKDEHGIIHIVMKDCGIVDKYDIIDLSLVVKSMAEGKPALKLFDARGKWNLTKEAKNKAAQMDSSQKTRARAIVVSGVLKAGLLKFFQTLSKLDYPQQIFTNTNDAYLWLATFKNYNPSELYI